MAAECKGFVVRATRNGLCFGHDVNGRRSWRLWTEAKVFDDYGIACEVEQRYPVGSCEVRKLVLDFERVPWVSFDSV